MCVTCVTFSGSGSCILTAVESLLFMKVFVLETLRKPQQEPPGPVCVFPFGAFETLHLAGLQKDSGCTPEAWVGLCSSESGHLSNSVTFQGNVCRLIWVTLSVCFCCSSLVKSSTRVYGLSWKRYRVERVPELESSFIHVYSSLYLLMLLKIKFWFLAMVKLSSLTFCIAFTKKPS